MKPRLRREKILQVLRALQKEVRVEELADMLEVSPLTVRRDLDVLAKDRAVIRTYGGCLAVGRAALETEYHKKVALNFELKRAIAVTAAQDLAPNQVILMNDGSTTFHLAAQLGAVGSFTIYTNSLAMISEFSRFDGIRLYLLGGEYSDEHYSLRGGLTEQVLSLLKFDRVYLGADGIDEHGRCLVTTPEDARLTQVMLERGGTRILLADHTKVRGRAHASYGSLSDFDQWITTPGMPSDLLRIFREETDVVVAPVDHDESVPARIDTDQGPG